MLLEVVYSVTDPPIKALRRVIPPLRLGSVALDLSFLIVIIARLRAAAGQPGRLPRLTAGAPGAVSLLPHGRRYCSTDSSLTIYEWVRSCR